MTRHNTSTKQASLILVEMECDHGAIGDYAKLISVLSEGTEISEAAVPGMYRLCALIEDHVTAINDKIEEALTLLREAEPAALSLVSG